MKHDAQDRVFKTEIYKIVNLSEQLTGIGRDGGGAAHDVRQEYSVAARLLLPFVVSTNSSLRALALKTYIYIYMGPSLSAARSICS